MVGFFFSGKKEAHKLRKSSWDTGRVSLGHPAGQTGVYRPVFQRLNAAYSGKTDTKEHFCWDTGQVSSSGFQEFYVIFSYVPFLLPILFFGGGSFFTYVGAFLLTVKLLCLPSIQVLIRGTFQL